MIELEATSKQLKKYGKTQIIHPLNPRYEEIELDRSREYQVIGVVVEKKKRYRQESGYGKKGDQAWMLPEENGLSHRHCKPTV